MMSRSAWFLLILFLAVVSGFSCGGGNSQMQPPPPPPPPDTFTTTTSQQGSLLIVSKPDVHGYDSDWVGDCLGRKHCGSQFWRHHDGIRLEL